MKKFLLIVFIIGLLSNSYAADADKEVEQAYEKWVEFFDKNLRAIKLYEPELYSEILDGVRDDLKNRSTKQVLLWNVMKKQTPLVEKYIVPAPLSILDEFHSQEIAKIDYLIKENKIECVQLLFSESPSSVNEIGLIPAELLDSKGLMEKAILARRSGFKPEIDLEKGELEYTNLVLSMQSEYGVELRQAIENPVSIRSCEILNEIDKRISAMGDSKRENVLRYLYSPE